MTTRRDRKTASRKRVSGALLFATMGLTLTTALAATPVSVVTPTAVDTAPALRLSGTVTAQRQAMLSPRLDGLVAELGVETGDRVTAGTVLLRLDPALVERQLQLAEAAAEEARAAADEAARRVQEALQLRDENYISATELASRRSTLAMASAALRAAEAEQQLIAEQRDRHALPAPFAGVIAERMTEMGEWVNRGDAVFRLVAPERVWLDVQVPQEHYGRLSMNAVVTILPDGNNAAAVEGRILATVPVSSVQARAFLVRVVPTAAAEALFPGTSATALIPFGDGSSTGFALPREALIIHPDGGRSVFIVDSDSRARRRSVVVSEETSARVIIREGLSGRDRVVVRGGALLRDGEQVELVAGTAARR